MATGAQVQQVKQHKAKARRGNHQGDTTTAVGAVARLIKKLRVVEHAIAETHGALELLALVLREDADWEVVVCAPWLDAGLAGTTFMVGQLRKVLSGAEIVSLAGVITLERKSPFLKELRSCIRVAAPSDSILEFNHVTIADMKISRAFILTADPKVYSRRPI